MNELTDLQLGGLGRFEKDFASFATTRYHLERDWDYIYGDERLFWRIHHTGRGYLQDIPPGGIYWLNAPGDTDVPPWQVFFVDGEAGSGFTNFRGPLPGDIDLAQDQTQFECRWLLHKGVFRVKWNGLVSETQLGTAASMPAALMKVKLTNEGQRPRRVAVIPRVMPWLTSPMAAAWDMPWLFQSSRFDRTANSVLFQMGSPQGIPEKRRSLVFMLDKPFDRLCLLDKVFQGRGSRTEPAALTKWRDWPQLEDTFVYGERLFGAFAKEITLKPGESWEFTMVMSDRVSAQPALRKMLSDVDGEFGRVEARRKELINRFRIETPDPSFTRYANEYLGLQQQLILRRGWPCNMMGVRDAAQDHTGAVTWLPQQSRKMILAILETERSDGWFVRQFSTDGRKGKHDSRPYVDSGLWVWELVYEYVCQTKDWALLEEKLPFLDSDAETTVLDHLGRLLGYFTNPANIGEHGLCKILEGDWNDSVNRAGLEGRGESVMVSCHLIYCLRQAAKLGEFLKGKKGLPDPALCLEAAEKMRQTVRKSALNPLGYLNGVFADNGKWFFSERDPDGKERFNMPVNAFGIIAGVFEKAELGRLCERIKSLRMPHGYPLFAPPIGVPPMDGLGRIGSGDLPPGLGENGTCYNHGCHGFLARAMAEAGKGDLFYDVMLCLFPYDQDRHPVHSTRTPPYAVVNVYKGAPGREGEGGDTFFSGTISVAVRDIYQGMLGIHAEPTGLRITPCMPTSWRRIEGRVIYAGKPLDIMVERDGQNLVIKANGKRVENNWLAD